MEICRETVKCVAIYIEGQGPLNLLIVQLILVDRRHIVKGPSEAHTNSSEAG